jgi:arsenite methyltransferase
MVYVPSANRHVIFDAVRAMYTDVARHPDRGFHFPTGLKACTFVGYPLEQVAGLPSCAVESFAGVGYPFAANVIRAGDTVLDIGAGSGTDALLAAAIVGDAGQVIGLDLTSAMLAKLNASAAAAHVANVRALESNGEQIPLPDASVDVVTSNGVLNLIPDKRTVFAEIHRVLKPGGRLQLADIALGRPLSGECLDNPRLWVECIVGATPEDEYVGLIEGLGFTAAHVLGRLNYFCASTSVETRSIARSFNAGSIVLRAIKPPVSPLPEPAPWPTAAATPNDAAIEPVETPSVDAVLDGYGQLCGTLEPAMRAGMRPLSSGQVLEVRADDLAARLGVPAWTRLAGHTLLLTIEQDARRTRFFLRKR